MTPCDQLQHSLFGRLIGSARQALPTILVLAIGTVALELAFRWIAPELGHRRYDRRFTGSHAVAPNELGTRGGVPARDSAYPVVVALGDSTTWGTGVGTEELWTTRLKENVSEKTPVETLMGAWPGQDLRPLQQTLEELADDRHVDLAVVALCGNMVSLSKIRSGGTPQSIFAWISTDPPPPPGLKDNLKYLFQDSALTGGIIQFAEILGYATGVNHHRIDAESPFGAMLAHGWKQAGLDPEVAEHAWALFEQDLRDLRDACSERGIPLIATWMPSRFTVSEDPRDNLKFVPRDRLAIDPNERAKAICDRLAIPFADSLAAMRERRRRDGWTPLYVPGDYTHLDPSGHAAVAEALAPLVSSALGGDRSPASDAVD